MERHARPLAERFWAKVDRQDDEACWPWRGTTNGRGYGWIGLGRRGGGSTTAHRVAYELTYGPVPDGVYVMHRCDNRSCVNPAHLTTGTPLDNMRDMRAKGRERKPGARGTTNRSAALTAEDVVAARALAADGWSFAAIGHRFGVGRSAARKAVLGLTWSHLT